MWCRVTDELCYTPFEVLNTVRLSPGCSSIIQYRVSMSVSIHCFSFTMISLVGQRGPKVAKDCPVKRSSRSNCIKSLNSPLCMVRISSLTL